MTLPSREAAAGAGTAAPPSLTRLWVDDEKPEPVGWSRARGYLPALRMLRDYEWDVVALDHDLGDDGSPTGYDLLCAMERGELRRPKAIAIISWNSVGAKRMLAALAQMPDVRNLGWDLELSASGWKESERPKL